jgi:hypothetical protein
MDVKFIWSLQMVSELLFEIWAWGPKLQALAPAPPNLQTKHRNFNTSIKINEIHIENVKNKYHNKKKNKY